MCLMCFHHDKIMFFTKFNLQNKCIVNMIMVNIHQKDNEVFDFYTSEIFTSKIVDFFFGIFKILHNFYPKSKHLIIFRKSCVFRLHILYFPKIFFGIISVIYEQYTSAHMLRATFQLSKNKNYYWNDQNWIKIYPKFHQYFFQILIFCAFCTQIIK